MQKDINIDMLLPPIINKKIDSFFMKNNTDTLKKSVIKNCEEWLNNNSRNNIKILCVNSNKNSYVNNNKNGEKKKLEKIKKNI